MPSSLIGSTKIHDVTCHNPEDNFQGDFLSNFQVALQKSQNKNTVVKNQVELTLKMSLFVDCCTMLYNENLRNEA
jgi:hypothetical protein